MYFSKGTGDAIAFYFVAGIVATIIMWLTIPPAIVASLVWLLAPRLNLETQWLDAWLWIALIWWVANATVWLVGKFRSWLRARKHEREHKEFMTLRARFYASNEVCTENLASLRARAAQADGIQNDKG